MMMKILSNQLMMYFLNRLKTVPMTGLEPACPYEHHPLKVACLPISPHGHLFKELLLSEFL